MASIKAGGAALNQTPLHWENNLENIRQAISMAKTSGLQILCLPELCLTGYGCEDLFLSDWVPEKALGLLTEILPQTKNIAVTVGLPIRLKGLTYNCVAVLEDEKILGISAKQFLANDGVHYEPRWFTGWKAGEITEIDIHGQKVLFGDLIFNIAGVTVGFEICEDAWREDRPACRMVDKNVELILNPSASHFGFGKTQIREQLVVDGSKTFSCYYIYVNLLGNEAGRMIYDGEIIIAGHGRLLQFNEKLSFRDVNLVVSTLDTRDRAPKGIAEAIPSEENNDMFIRAEALALFDYLRKSRSRGFVLSLSGGADSSTCAVLVAEMVRRSLKELGLEKMLKKIHQAELISGCRELPVADQEKFIMHHLLHCAYQGTVNSSEETLASARFLAEDIGASFDHWLIDDEVRSYTQKIEHALGRRLSWASDDLALQNIQSRARSPIIWMLANINNALLLVTSNRSEGDVGYATMDGDTSGSIAPIAAVDKHFILGWLQWAEKQLGYRGLRYVNSLTPTAELRPPERFQTDEADLMPYSVIVEIEKLAIRDRFSPVEVFRILASRKLEEEPLLKLHIRKFFTLWCRNQWKRERTAPAFHLDDFNVDPRTWCRFPILSSGYEQELSELDKL